MLTRRGFLATLAAVPLAALLPMPASAPVMACPVRGLPECEHAYSADAFVTYYHHSFRFNVVHPARCFRIDGAVR